MKRVLVTGGCGFLGSNLASNFLKEGWVVVVADALFRRGGQANLEWLKSQARNEQHFSWICCDLADEKAVTDLFQKFGPFDFICHLAGQVAMTTSLENPRRDLMTNVVGTFNILEATRQYSPNAFLAYSSTNKVYGDLDWVKYNEDTSRYTCPKFPKGFDETLPLDFASPYGCSKGAADQYVRDWFRNFKVKTAVFRHSSIYGDRQFATFDQGWIGWFCAQAIAQTKAQRIAQKIEPFTISGNGKQVRDVLHRDDLVRLYMAAYANQQSVAGEIFNIGGGMDNSLSLLELFDLLRELTGTELSFIKNPPRQSDQKVFVADISKAKRLLNWEPRVTKQEGISRMLEWVSAETNSVR